MENQGLSTALLRLRFEQEKSFANLRRVAVAVHKDEPPERDDLAACFDLVLRQCEVITGLCAMAGEKPETEAETEA